MLYHSNVMWLLLYNLNNIFLYFYSINNFVHKCNLKCYLFQITTWIPTKSVREDGDLTFLLGQGKNMSMWNDLTKTFAWVMLEHPTSLAVFTSWSQKGRLKITGGTLPLASLIFWRRITNRSLLSTTYPQPKLTLTYCLETVGERAERFLTCSWYFLHCWENGNLFNSNTACGENRNFTFPVL